MDTVERIGKLERQVDELQRSTRHFMSVMHEQMQKYKEHMQDVNNELKEHLMQINRRPVDMEQMKHELYDQVEKQVADKLDDYSMAFDRAIDSYMWKARLVPVSKLNEMMRDETDLTLSGSFKDEYNKEKNKDG
tara:strand:- start:1036 stop:1437 length:402 start_codon:yes stop_codon:yes gene_type:complete